MQRKIALAIWLMALSLLMASLLIFACADSGGNDNDDYDDNDDEATPDLNGWADEDGKYTFQDDNNQQCPPPLPEGMREQPIQIILDAYMGFYSDEYGNERHLECDPQGVWEMTLVDDDSLCAASWHIPVLATIAEQELELAGFINELDNPWASGSGELYLEYEDKMIYGDRFYMSGGFFKIVFTDPTFGAVWTKEE